MATLSNTHSSGRLQGGGIPGWIRAISLRSVGIMVLILALLLTIASYTLHAQLNYPEILLDKASFAKSLLAQGEIGALSGFVALLGCGILLCIISLALLPHLEEKRRRYVSIAGGASGICWAVGALMGLILTPLWANALTNVAQVLAPSFFVLTEVVTPLLLLIWTMMLARQFRAYRVLGEIGLLLVLLRSLVWGLNAILPLASGFYGTAGVVNILAVLGESLWLVWLLLFGFRLLLQRTKAGISTAPAGDVKEERVLRRRFLKVATGLGLGLAGAVFVGARTGLTLTNLPVLEGDDVPSEPSFIGTLFYLIVMIYQGQHPVNTVAQELALTHDKLPLPAGVVLENVNASGVPAQFISAPGVTKSRVILYVHGGGWAVPLEDADRVYAASLSQELGASVLLPEYRLLPDHPFPVGLQDCVTTYRWLRRQGVAASQIVIMGGSAGANLTLAIAVFLQESGEALPAALVAQSPPTDLAMTSETYRTKAWLDPILGGGLGKNTFVDYTNNGAIDVRNPLVSPLYANLHGFPPTFLQVGTQEILLGDAIQMADRLKAAGVEVKLEVWPGMFHGWQSISYIPEAQLAHEHVVKFIRQHLGR